MHYFDQLSVVTEELFYKILQARHLIAIGGAYAEQFTPGFLHITTGMATSWVELHNNLQLLTPNQLLFMHNQPGFTQLYTLFYDIEPIINEPLPANWYIQNEANTLYTENM